METGNTEAFLWLRFVTNGYTQESSAEVEIRPQNIIVISRIKNQKSQNFYFDILLSIAIYRVFLASQ